MVLFVYGTSILFLLRETRAVNERANGAFRNVTIMLISSLLGFLVMMISLGLDTLPSPTIPLVSLSFISIAN